VAAVIILFFFFGRNQSASQLGTYYSIQSRTYRLRKDQYARALEREVTRLRARELDLVRESQRLRNLVDACPQKCHQDCYYPSAVAPAVETPAVARRNDQPCDAGLTATGMEFVLA